MLAFMKFVAVILAYLFVSFILGWGILQAVHGHYWLLGTGIVAYLLAFSKLGCLPPNSSH